MKKKVTVYLFMLFRVVSNFKTNAYLCINYGHQRTATHLRRTPQQRGAGGTTPGQGREDPFPGGAARIRRTALFLGLLAEGRAHHRLRAERLGGGGLLLSRPHANMRRGAGAVLPLATFDANIVIPFGISIFLHLQSIASPRCTRSCPCHRVILCLPQDDTMKVGPVLFYGVSCLLFLKLNEKPYFWRLFETIRTS